VRSSVPKVVVVGLGPAGPELVPPLTSDLLGSGGPAFLRTAHHPAASAFPTTPTMDHCYEQERTFEAVYHRIVDELVDAARDAEERTVAYAVPGSPMVAEDTVMSLLGDDRVRTEVHPAPSFLDLAWQRLRVDPLDAGVMLVDGARFAHQAAAHPGPFLVAQCWSDAILSEIKLSVPDGVDPGPVTLLRHLGLADEDVVEVAWDDLDRTCAADHLTSLFVPQLASPVGAELVALDELTRTLRARCPWDARQTHGSLARHLLEESYEVIDALEDLTALEGSQPGVVRGQPVVRDRAQAEARAVEHLREELGDLLFQVYFHARLAAEEGRFTIADVASGIREKLVARHPHVFGDVVAHSASEVADRWETAKLAEKGRQSVTDGIPPALPALSLVGELQRKAAAAGMEPTSRDELEAAVSRQLRVLDDADSSADPDAGTDRGTRPDHAPGNPGGELLLAAAELVRRSGADPELSLRRAAGELRARIRRAEGLEERPAAERDAPGAGGSLGVPRGDPSRQ